MGQGTGGEQDWVHPRLSADGLAFLQAPTEQALRAHLSTKLPVLKAYSPLHNVKRGTMYPPTLIVTGDHDDRVVPAHSFKFAAAMQAAQAPVLIRIDVAAGHGTGKPLHKQIEEAADSMAFLAHALGAE